MKIKKKIIYFQLSIVQDIHHFSKRERREHGGKILDQMETENLQGKLQILHLHAYCQSAPAPFSFPD